LKPKEAPHLTDSIVDASGVSYSVPFINLVVLDLSDKNIPMHAKIDLGSSSGEKPYDKDFLGTLGGGLFLYPPNLLDD
jgi:hypothetical protein